MGKTLVLSAYDTLGKEPNYDISLSKPSLERWVSNKGYELKFMSEGFISPYMNSVKIKYEERRNCAIADYARLKWIKHYLDSYDNVIWVDGDLLLLNGFDVITPPSGMPLLTDNNYIDNSDMLLNDEDSWNISGNANWCRKNNYNIDMMVTTTVMNFCKETDRRFMDTFLTTIEMMSEYHDPKIWCSYSTYMMSVLGRLYKFPIHYGVGFLSPSSFDRMWCDEGLTKRWLRNYSKMYEVTVGGGLTSINLSTDKDRNKMRKWVEIINNLGIIYS